MNYTEKEVDEIDWHQVPYEHLASWQDVFQASREMVDLSAPCPICGAPALHRWYLVGHPHEFVYEGTKYVAHGALWEWCSSCGSFVHCSSSVPEWWSSDLEVDTSKLTYVPDALEEAIRKRREKAA
jgi:hypothetical protein